MIDIQDNQTLVEKIMAHFGWYKCKMVEFPAVRIETNIIVEVPETPAPEKKPTTRTRKVVK
jgi:hypothetical protein